MSRSGGRGFSLLELVVATALIAVLSMVMLDRLLFYQEQAEKTAFNAVLGALRSGLRLHSAMLLIREGPRNLASLADKNPMEVLGESPADFRGTLDGGSPEGPGWYFDSEDKVLIYIPNVDRSLRVSGGGRALRFKVSVMPGGGVQLLPVLAYEWR